jgi:hypothetical protein
VVDHVVGVFLQRVIHARFEVGLRAVIIHAQPAADIQESQSRTRLCQVDIDAHRLVHGTLDLPDVGDLAAQMEVQKVEAIRHAEIPQLLQGAHRLRHR